MRKKDENIKVMNIRLRKEVWAFLRKLAFDQESSINELINVCLEKVKKNHDNMLTSAKDVVL